MPRKSRQVWLTNSQPDWSVHPDDHRRAVGQCPEAHFAFAQPTIGLVAFPQEAGLFFSERDECVTLPGQLLPLPVQVQENPGLAAQHVRLNGLVEKIHRAGLVAAKAAQVVLRPCRQKNNRHMLGALRATHEFRQFKAVHDRHLDIDDSQGDVVLEQQLKRFPPGPGA
jgi:hypothetical protein